MTHRAARRAYESGALAPSDTRIETVSEQGITYVVRVLNNIRRKHQASRDRSTDPFAAPYESDLVIAALAPAHMALLNKFPVLDRHLLAVTRRYEPQTHLLTIADCEALLHLLHGWDGLAFYNGGLDAGASQRHKHLQMVDLPAESGLPVATALAASQIDNGIGRSPELPFPHACARMPESAWRDPSMGAATVYGIYLELLEAVGLPSIGRQQPGPYNLLATREWLWVVPRCRQAYQGIEVNALGFAGTLLVSDEAHLSALKSLGVTACLRGVCV